MQDDIFGFYRMALLSYDLIYKFVETFGNLYASTDFCGRKGDFCAADSHVNLPIFNLRNCFFD